MILFIILKFIILLPIIIPLTIYDRYKQKANLHLYGIYGFFGLPGEGKTISMSRRLNEYREKYGQDIYIMTNYNYDKQDMAFSSWTQLLKTYDKPLVVAWDEVQNEFSAREYKNFPIQLLTLLTQNRKGHGIQILYTSQRWHFVDKTFRSLTMGCYDCHTWLGRYTYGLCYRPDDYDQKCNTVNVDNKTKIRAIDNFSFIQTNKERECFDSFKMLESAKQKEYMDREELAKIYDCD